MWATATDLIGFGSNRNQGRKSATNFGRNRIIAKSR